MSDNQKQSASQTPLGKITGIDSRGEQLVKVNDHTWVSKDISDSILVTTPAGNVVINSGMPGQGAAHKQRFAEVASGDIEYLVITQCHGDHFGGAADLRDAGTRIITHERYPECRSYWKELEAFYARRSGKLWGPVLGDRRTAPEPLQEVTPDITFRDDHVLELGGRRFELYAAPGGESRDGIVVWLPQDRTVITGNLFGPVFGNMPNLYTIRGDKIRSAKRFMQDLDFVLSLQPETIITGHEVFEGEETIRRRLEDVREAVQHVYDYTIAGMNAGTDVYTLMREVSLPPHLSVGQAHGKLSWCVRAIWEEYAGWFHYDATTSLYGVPRESVAADIVDLAGGGEALAARAQTHVDRGDPLQALHLVDIVLAVEPANPDALRVKIAAHELLLEATGGENFSEVMWLRSEIQSAQSILADEVPND